MKAAKVLLALSLVANAALAVAWFWPRAEAAPAAAPIAKSAAPVKAAAAPTPTREQEIAAAIAADPEFAEAVKSGDPKRLREALTRAGFPPDYVRDMVTFFTGNTVSPEHLAQLRAKAARPFWKVSPSAEEISLQKLLAERTAKNDAITKEAFGGKIPPHPLEAQNLQRRYRFLPEDKIATVAKIDSDYNEQVMAGRNSSDQQDEAREKQRRAALERREALSKILTPAELELYDLNVSNTAQNMRSTLTLFQPTEAEFKALYDLRHTYDEKYATFYGYNVPNPSAAEMAQRAADLKAVDTQIRTLLGDQRYAEYTRAQDYGYRAAVEIATHYNLPPTTATQAYAIQQELVDRMKAPDSTTDARTRAAAVLAEAETRLTALFGPAGYDAYKKTGGRFWMTGLERTVNPPTPKR